MADALGPLSLALFSLRVVSPALVLLATLSIVPSKPSPPPSPSPITSVVVASKIPRRALILSLLSLASLTYLLDGLAFVVFAVLTKTWPYQTGIEVNAIAGLVAFSGMAALGAYKDATGVEVWSFKRIKSSVLLSLILDIATVALYGVVIPKSTHGRLPFSISGLVHFVLPLFRVLLLVPLFFALISPRITYTPVNADALEEPTEASLLVPPSEAHASGLSPNAAPESSKYGTFRSSVSGGNATTASGVTTRAQTPDPAGRVQPLKPDPKEKEINLDPSWSEIFQRLRRITPFLWPSKSPILQFTAFLCILLLLLGRLINVAVPMVLAQLISIFDGKVTQSPWPYLFGYAALRFLQGSGGLAALRDALWAPVMQYSDREMSQLSFNHLLNLSFAWHSRRKTGEVLRILDRGAAINHTLELILFQIVPTIIDIIVALVFFTLRLDWTIAVVIFLVMFTYGTASVLLTRWRTKLRRQMNDKDMVSRAIHTDCLLNYETVKYFNGEEHEGERYAGAIRDYQSFEYRVILSLNLLNLVQNLIITVGLLVGSLIVALRVTQGTLETADFVFFMTYLGQLYGPLNSLGYIYRSINQSLVDTERLLKLLNEPTEVNDLPNAPDLIVTDGEIEFDNVNFSYDGRSTALKGISFKVPKGSSVALVGESGAGKSTVLRLLYRFYDLKEGGRILIDGQDIREVTQASLRKAIGVVPQDSVLFNASIAYNIGYGKFGASQEEIEDAAKAAQMHDRISSFPDGYSTKVGERGIRLSGGEKQRVAIARTLLKNPPILLLDEATSALDTSTERDIQKALQNLVQGRSSLSIAHRLSTIATADVILVLKDGQIVEQGSHKELLEQNGIFASMWAEQISANEEATAGTQGKASFQGYSVEDKPAEEIAAPDAAERPTQDTSNDVDAAEPAPAQQDAVTEDTAAPITDDAPTNDVPAPSTHEDIEQVTAEPVAEDAPVAFPTSGDEEPAEEAKETEEPAIVSSPVSSPIEFPTSDDASASNAVPVSSPGITFAPEVSSPPRTGTPDPESEPKRKRISSQNFQRLARRISLSTKRQGSSSSFPSIPGLKRDGSKDESAVGGHARGESSVTDAPRTDSPVPSVQGSEGGKEKTQKKKEKKLKRKSTSTSGANA